MEKKKSTVATVLLLIAVLVIGAMAGYIYMQKVETDKKILQLEAQKVEMQTKIDNLQGKIDTIANTINDTVVNKEDNIKKEDESVNNKEVISNGVVIDKTVKLKENAKYNEITKELEENEAIYITNIKKESNGKYTISGVSFKEFKITESEKKQLLEGAAIVINNEKYYYSGNQDLENIELKNEKNQISHFIIRKKGNEYVLESQTENYLSRKMTEEYLTITLDSTSKYVQYDAIITDEGVAENKIGTLEELYNEFKYEKPIDQTHPTGIYGLTFENGKCIEIYPIVSGY